MGILPWFWSILDWMEQDTYIYMILAIIHLVFQNLTSIFSEVNIFSKFKPFEKMDTFAFIEDYEKFSLSQQMLLNPDKQIIKLLVHN